MLVCLYARPTKLDDTRVKQQRPKPIVCAAPTTSHGLAIGGSGECATNSKYSNLSFSQVKSKNVLMKLSFWRIVWILKVIVNATEHSAVNIRKYVTRQSRASAVCVSRSFVPQNAVIKYRRQNKSNETKEEEVI